MSNLKNQDPKYAGGKPRAFKGWSLLAGLMIVAVLAAAPTLLGLADAGGGKGHSFGDVTFTKWITMYPTMKGIVGGAVGDGTFAGEIVSMTGSDDGKTTFVEAVYHINGSSRSFTANIRAVQDNGAGTGVITGKITEGWLEGKALSGEYTVIPECQVGSYSGMCFQGTLHIVPAP
jgi:hypothetical protein